MTRLVAPNKGVGVDIDTPRGRVSLNPDRNSMITVNDPKTIKALKEEGFFEASLAGVTATSKLGYTCSKCGFGSWFKKCSKCGNESKD